MAEVAESTLTRVELIKLFSESLGAEKAAATVTATAVSAGLADLTQYNRTQVLVILEKMVLMPGLVGIVARFIKVGVILKLK